MLPYIGTACGWGMAFGMRAEATEVWPGVANEATGPSNGFPEIDCIRSILTPGVVEAAKRRAERLGVGADWPAPIEWSGGHVSLRLGAVPA